MTDRYTPLERISPESAGIESGSVQACLEALTKENTEIHGFMAARHGKVFAECWWSPYRADLPHSNHSLGKSYAATAVAAAYTEGLLTLEEKITAIFAEEFAQSGAEMTEYWQQLTIRDVLVMANGMPRHPIMTDDWLGDYFREPVTEKPGTVFHYNTSGSCLLAAIVQKKTGRPVKEYLAEKVFDKIGIDGKAFRWFQFKDGTNAAPGTLCKTEDNLRLALLYMNHGVWNGEKILDADWVRQAMSVQIETGDGGIPDCSSGYGYQLWACTRPGVFRFDGGQGQYAVMCPEKDLVVVVHQGAVAPGGNQTTLDVIYEKLLDAVTDATLPENEQAQNELKNWMASRCVPNFQPNTLVVSPDVFSGNYTVTEAQEGADPWVMLAPGPVNHYHIFYDTNKPIAMKNFSLEIQEEKCILLVNGCSQFDAFWDGENRLTATDNPMPGYDVTCSAARYVDENTLEITIRWANSWFINVMTFVREGDEVQITIAKDRRQEDERWRNFSARAKKSRE